jgi:hypothetical protein
VKHLAIVSGLHRSLNFSTSLQWLTYQEDSMANQTRIVLDADDRPKAEQILRLRESKHSANYFLSSSSTMATTWLAL